MNSLEWLKACAEPLDETTDTDTALTGQHAAPRLHPSSLFFLSNPGLPKAPMTLAISLPCSARSFNHAQLQRPPY